jgi:hypothetical protein
MWLTSKAKDQKALFNPRPQVAETGKSRIKNPRSAWATE